MAKRTSEKKSDATLDMADEIREAGGDPGLPERYSEDGIQERRDHVLKFLAKRVPQTVMAELLGVSRRTIANDVAWWKERNQEQINKIKNNADEADADIGMTVLRLEGIAAAAMTDYELARTPQMKNLFLNTAIKAEMAGATVKTTTGVWPKAGEELRIRHEVKATFSAKLGENSPLKTLDEAASRRRVLTAVEQTLRLAMDRKGGDGKVIDVPAQVKSA